MVCAPHRDSWAPGDTAVVKGHAFTRQVNLELLTKHGLQFKQVALRFMTQTNAAIILANGKMGADDIRQVGCVELNSIKADSCLAFRAMVIVAVNMCKKAQLRSAHEADQRINAMTRRVNEATAELETPDGGPGGV